MSWFLDRIADRYNIGMEDVEFCLMHKFTPGGFFDHHVDASPSGDPTQRTFNINAMLSIPSEYTGGTLSIFNETMDVNTVETAATSTCCLPVLRRGDYYWRAVHARVGCY